MSQEQTNQQEAGGSGNDDWTAALAEQASSGNEGDAESQDSPRRVNMPPLRADGAAASGEDNLDVVLDIPVTISMEIGRTKIPIRNLLQLNQGSVLELERIAGEPLDVMVNGMLIAHGEVVVVNERFGIRFTDVISPAERVQKLR